jgi:hypothetical protein
LKKPYEYASLLPNGDVPNTASISLVSVTFKDAEPKVDKTKSPLPSASAKV